MRRPPVQCYRRDLCSGNFWFHRDVAPNDGGDGSTQQRCHDEEPELRQGGSPLEECRADAAGRVYRCAGDGDTDNVHQHQCQSDGQSGELVQTVLCCTPSTTSTKMKVKTVSATNAVVIAPRQSRWHLSGWWWSRNLWPGTRGWRSR